MNRKRIIPYLVLITILICVSVNYRNEFVFASTAEINYDYTENTDSNSFLDFELPTWVCVIIVIIFGVGMHIAGKYLESCDKDDDTNNTFPKDKT